MHERVCIAASAGLVRRARDQLAGRTQDRKEDEALLQEAFSGLSRSSRITRTRHWWTAG